MLRWTLLAGAASLPLALALVQTTKRALSHSRCHEECLERLSVAWKTTKGSESDAARRLIRRSENGRLTLGAPYAERLQTQIPTTKSRNDANASTSSS